MWNKLLGIDVIDHKGDACHLKVLLFFFEGKFESIIISCSEIVEIKSCGNFVFIRGNDQNTAMFYWFLHLEFGNRNWFI